MPMRAEGGEEPSSGKRPRRGLDDLLIRKLAPREDEDPSSFKLEDGSRVGVIGAGPSGSFFSYFLLRLARRVGIDIHLDVFEPRDFSKPGPAGCNMCGGIVSESLVQMLAAEGINLPSTVVQRGIHSYKLHTDDGSVLIKTPLEEKRIAAVHRGPGPRGLRQEKWMSFDGYLLGLARAKGANVIHQRVDAVSFEEGRPRLKTKDSSPEPYDLLAVATGVNSAALKLFQGLEVGYEPPRSTKTAIVEFYMGEEALSSYLGDSMHVYLLNVPRLKFAAIIPKGDYMTVCLLGEDIDKELVGAFLAHPAVRKTMPPDWSPEDAQCQCLPKMNVRGVPRPYADRLVFIGDSGMNRLNKDGIGGAFRTAKAAAVCSVLEGVAAEDFRRHFMPVCSSIGADNMMGELVFHVVRQIQRWSFARRGILRMARREQTKAGGTRRMSTVLWDTFTGSAPYREILLRTMHPAYLARFFADMALSLVATQEDEPAGGPTLTEESTS